MALKRNIRTLLTRIRWGRKCQLAKSSLILGNGKLENIYGRKDAISIGEWTAIRGRLMTYGHGGKIQIGDYCYVGDRSEIWSSESITIGDRVLISHDVNIHDGTAHSLDSVERHNHFKQIMSQGHPNTRPAGFRSAPIVIENDCWISFGVTILQGVRIGEQSVISAGAIVTKDVPAKTIYRCEFNPVVRSIVKEVTLRN